MQCPNCRTMNEEDASFCENCGTRLAAGMPVMQPVMQQIVQGPPVKVSRPVLFAVMLWIGLVLMFFAGVLVNEGPDEAAAIVAIPGLVLIVAASIYSLVTLHRCWSVLRGNTNVTTPGKAVGLLFIPVFNFYWAFIAFGKLPDEAGRYIASLHGGKPPISKGLSITFCILILTILAAVPVFGLAFGMVFALINQFLFIALMFQWSAFLRAAARQPAARQAA